MQSFKTFINKLEEENINYNHTRQSWQVRDNDNNSLKYEKPHVFIKNAKPHIDHEAHESGKRVYAYLQGDVTNETPEHHTQREIKFQPSNVDHPFIHTDDNTPLKHADFIEFNKNKVTAHYKNN